MTKKHKPVAICTKCGRHTDNINLINNPCPITYQKSGKCRGVCRSMLSHGDWKECGDCSATGIINDQDCSACKGFGWICVRKNY